MRLPILVGARPKNIQSTPRVRLSPGKWVIAVTDLIDSVFILHRNDLQIPLGEQVDGDCILQLKFEFKGKEDRLTIFAERLEQNA